MSSPMRPVVKFGHRPHPIDRKKYGQPRIALYWAGRRHVARGLVLWIGKRHVRIFPTNRVRSAVPGDNK